MLTERVYVFRFVLAEWQIPENQKNPFGFHGNFLFKEAPYHANNEILLESPSFRVIHSNRTFYKCEQLSCVEFDSASKIQIQIPQISEVHRKRNKQKKNLPWNEPENSFIECDVSFHNYVSKQSIIRRYYIEIMVNKWASNHTNCNAQSTCEEKKAFISIPQLKFHSSIQLIHMKNNSMFTGRPSCLSG